MAKKIEKKRIVQKYSFCFLIEKKRKKFFLQSEKRFFPSLYMYALLAAAGHLIYNFV